MATNTDSILIPQTCRAARGLLNMSQEDLARRSGVSRATVVDFERGLRRPIGATLAAMRRALEGAGVAFVPGGVLLRAQREPASSEGEERLAAVVRALRSNAAHLRRLGVRHVSIFGSVARGESGAGSDVDLMIELDPKREIDLLDYIGIADEIQNVVPLRVDVARKDRLKPHVAATALRDEIRVF